MPKIAEKSLVVDEIKERLSRASSLVMVDARGLSVEQDTRLRKMLREAGVEYKVYKNTTMGFAIQGGDFAGLQSYLAGPSAFAFSYEDPMMAAKIILRELKGMPQLEFKAGYIDGTVYDAEGVKAIASIPPREELLSKLLGSFKSPMGSFARVISQIAEKDQESA